MPFTAYDIECIKNAKDFIDADLSVHHSISSLAEKSCIGQTKLKEGFHNIYSMGLFTYLRQQRMLRAADLLHDHNKTIKQIAKAVGFRYTSNFMIAFLKYHKITPHKYRLKNCL